MKYTCIIVEDEPLAVERIKDYIAKIPFLSLLAAFDNAQDALVFLKTNEVNILFLDIHLGTMSGIQLLENATITSQVILTTAYHEYALKAYDLKVADYLLKPYTFERFFQAVERAQSFFQKEETPIKDKNYFFVKVEYGVLTNTKLMHANNNIKRYNSLLPRLNLNNT